MISNVKNRRIQLPPGWINRIALLGFLSSLYLKVKLLSQLLLLSEPLAMGHYMVDEFGQARVSTDVFGVIGIIVLFAFGYLRQHYLLILLGLAVARVRSMIGLATYESFFATYADPLTNLALFSEMPYRPFVLTIAVLGCMMSILFVLGLLTGELFDGFWKTMSGTSTPRHGSES